MYTIKERSIIISIDTDKCITCTSKACIEACRLYARGILAPDKNGAPSTAHLSEEETLRLGTECLACEYACDTRGRGVITIDVPIKGLSAYMKGGV
ncbi:MAG: hypothetical protein LBS10_06080 [Gracilibacteraceae bacterium]|jgi:hypothetical protein|nr:hypothetical protein [Gracilibacteraceae bacterium]